MPLYRAEPEGWSRLDHRRQHRHRPCAVAVLAAEGYTVAATARDEVNLVSLAEEAAGAAGTHRGFPCDVTDTDGMAALVERIEAENGTIALAIFNAGNYFPTRGERLDVLNFTRTFEVNLFGVVNGLVPLAERMRERGSATSRWSPPSPAFWLAGHGRIRRFEGRARQPGGSAEI